MCCGPARGCRSPPSACAPRRLPVASPPQQEPRSRSAGTSLWVTTFLWFARSDERLVRHRLILERMSAVCTYAERKTHLRHDGDQRHLSNVARLSAHIGPRDQLRDRVTACQMRVVRNVRRVHRRVQHRVSPLDDVKLRRFRLLHELRSDVPTKNNVQGTEESKCQHPGWQAHSMLLMAALLTRGRSCTLEEWREQERA